MDVILLTVRYAGPALLIGLFVLGWLKLWSRPDYVFALIYAAGVFGCFLFASLFSPFREPYVWSGPYYYFYIDRFIVWGVVGALAFVVPAAALIAIRQRLIRLRDDAR